jgi:putative membrane protein
MVVSKFFSEADRGAIAAAVAEAERRTTGEIVPVLAARSDRYERAEDAIGFGLSILAVSAAWLGFQAVRPSSEAWATEPDVALGLTTLVVILIAAWIGGILLARAVPLLTRLAAGGATLRRRVQEAAADSFEQFHVRGTKGSTGIVLYISLFERIVCVEADRAISEKVDPAEWKSICDGLVRSMRDGRPREGLVEAIGKCGDLLARHFPASPSDVNELTNDLRILD